MLFKICLLSFLGFLPAPHKVSNKPIAPFGISINLYRVEKAQKLEDIKDLENQIEKAKSSHVNLYKITSDLLVIFLNTTDPYNDTHTIPYKALFGIKAYKQIRMGEVGGFLPASEILPITQWIRKTKIDTFTGFSSMYDHLSKEVKKELLEMGSDTKLNLFNGYVKPMTHLYFEALQNQNSIVFVGQ
jgi:hypothetical protein